MACALSGAAFAQENEGPSLMERGLEMFLDGLMDEMEPALKDLQGMAGEMEPALRELMQTMGPAFVELLGKIDDISAYHAPEILPNGDIIIRRKTPLEQEDDVDGEIEI